MDSYRIEWQNRLTHSMWRHAYLTKGRQHQHNTCAYTSKKKKTTVGEYNFCLMFSFIERYIRVVAITMNGDEKRCPKCGKAIIHLFVDRMPLVR